MKNLFKTIFVMALAMIVFQSNAQIKFGVKAGLNLANVSQNFKDSDYEFDTKMRAAYHIGATADIAFGDALFLQPGLIFTSKGYSYDLEAMAHEDGESVDGHDRYVLNYIEVPILVGYKISGFHVMAGPYVAFGIGGKNKWDYSYSYGGETESEKDSYSLKPTFGDVMVKDLDENDEADYYKALDYGVNIAVGYEIGAIVLNAGYSLGLGNITPTYDYTGTEYEDYLDELIEDGADYKMSNRVITVSVGYKFGK